MIKANLYDRTTIVELLVESFDENQSINYLIRQDKKRQQSIRALMDYSLKMCLLFGEVWLSNDHRACALVLYPHQKKTTFRSVCLDLKLIFRAIGIAGIVKAMKRETLIKEKHPKTKMAYLWFIGVNPLHQHSGIGSKLLKEVIVNAEAKGLPVFLETSTLRNLPWYRRLDFELYDELTLTYTLYFLKRDLSK